MYLKQNIFLWYIVLQLFCIYNMWYISPVKCVSYFYISTSRTMCAVPNTAVFCSSLISCFTAVLLRYCQSDFEMVQIAPIITDISYVFTFHMR